jgi:hypothetical protein
MSFDLMSPAIQDERMSTTTDTVTIRRAGAEDRVALSLLAMLDSAQPLRGAHALVAESAGLVLAAISLEDGRVIADPFFPTAHLVELLRARAGSLDAATQPRRRRFARRVLSPAA